MRSLILICLGASLCLAQATSSGPVLMGAGFSNPFPIQAAPGQLLTLFVQPGSGYNPSAPLPTISATFWNGKSKEAMPVLQTVQASTACSVSPSPVVCTSVLAVTVQIPFDVPFSSGIVVSLPSAIAISVNDVETPYIAVQTWPDRVHILTECDVIISPGSGPSLLQIPCAPMITHADGTQVSVASPAVAGEELVAYATGLGQTNPPVTTGQPAASGSPTVSTFNLDFNYRPNALATSPLPTAPVATFTGATKGYAGLYQINFIVPPPPAGLQPCASFGIASGIIEGVFSNLTVSAGSFFSFDGAGICVQPEPVLDPPAAR
ncbi:MAG: hypothetical protein WBE37_25415 [Bryobacteraceae bacterium]